MRKFLFCAGLLAFAASCSNDELASISQEESAKGITFTVVDDAATRGELGEMTNGKFPYFWYAETDRINIWSVKTKMGTSTTGKDAWSDWAADWTGQAVYKATQSKANGVFTAIDDANTLNFASKIEAGDDEAAVKSKTATFIATYPSEMTISGVETNATDDSVESITLANLPALTTQTVDENIGQIAMYSHTTGKKENSYDAVGEKINLKFIRPFTAALFKTKGINAEYSTIFGKLTSIELEMKGYEDEKDNSKDIAASYLNYGTKASYKITDIEKNEGEFIVNGKTEGDNDFDWTGDSNDPATSITLNVNKEWNDNKNAFMAISRIDRSGFKSKGVKETMEVTYSFENITFTETLTTDSNWPCPAEGETSAINVFVGMPALDMANYPYLVTNKTSSGNDRSLLVNSGKFEEALIKEGNTVSVEWPIGSGTKVALTEFQTIISKVELTDEDLKVLKSFTNLKYVRLDENETLPAETFRGLDLDTLNMAKLTEIENANAFKAAAGAYTGLKVVRLPKYTFPKTTINNVILNANALLKLDMSGVETMKNAFPAEGFSLNGFTQLVYVKVKDGVKLGSSAFNGCAALTNVDGTVDITDGAGAFESSGVTEITITGTEVPTNAFKNCGSLTKVNQGNGIFGPTKVGNAAFLGTGIINIDLSGVVTLGEEAFKSCTSLVGVEANGLNVLTVGAAAIPAKAFNGCTALKYVKFTNATSIAEDILAGTTLNEVKFAKVLTTGADVNTMFGTTTNTKLFLNPDQPLSWYEGNSFYPNGSKTASNAKKIDFKSIILEK